MNQAAKTHFLAAGAGVLLCLACQYFYGLGSTPSSAGPSKRIDLSIEDGQIYRVRRVIDGDTIVLDSGLHVRLAGINTPEVGHYLKDPAPMADRAREKCTELLQGKVVRLKLAREPLDAYGRVIAHIEVPGEHGVELSVEEALLKEGLARALNLGLDAETYRRLKQIQDQAQKEKKGIWKPAELNVELDSAKYPFWAASTSRLFHQAQCSGLRRVQEGNLIGFESLEEAVATGRRLCSQCVKSVVAEKHQRNDSSKH